MEVELIEGPILIRTLREEDVSALFEAARESIAEVSPWLPWCHENYSIEETREFIASRELASEGGEWYSFGIFEKDGGRFLGGVGINFINRVHQMANLGYWVRTLSAYWVRARPPGSGSVATNATRAAARFVAIRFEKPERLSSDSRGQRPRICDAN